MSGAAAFNLRRFAGVMGDAVTVEKVEASLKGALAPAQLEVIDTSGGCGASFQVSIASQAFEGKKLIEKHRMVNDALKEELKTIHALSIKKCVTPDKW